MPRLLLTIRLFAAALLSGAALASCDGVALTDELPLPPPTVGTLPIGFNATTTDVKPDATSRAGEAAETRGSLTNSNLTSMGVFAYYTGGSNWTTSHKPNFMFNQKVTRTNASAPWTYTPMKYWPNTPNERISFFAYAPSGAAGVSMVTSNTTANYPILKYVVPTTATSQTDLLAATPLMNKTQSTTALSFQMKHVMTRVLVKAKCTEAITMNSVQLNDAYSEAKLAFNATGTSWFEIKTLTNFTHSTPTSVPANTTKDVAEFFMVPAKGKSITITFGYGGKTETKTVSLPSAAWTQGTSIAYTLNIEVGSEVTLTVKSWNTNTSNGNMGQEGSNYPYVLNGVVYESAKKSYYVGENAIKTFPGGSGSDNGWYTWEQMENICKNLYTSGPYPKREWRLPSKDELYNIRKLKDINTNATPAPGTTYWSSTVNPNNSAQAYIVWGNDGSPQSEYRNKTTTGRSLCIRDMGEITVYPTYRVKDGYNIIYINANTTLGLMTSVADWQYFQAAVNRCNNATTGGHTDWRLPTRAECDLLRGIGERKTNAMWSSELGSAANTAYMWHMNYSGNGWQAISTNDGYTSGGAYCVRSY